MKSVVVLFVFACTFVCSFAQVVGTAEKPTEPASREDVQELQQELKRMRREAQLAEKNSVSRNAQERQRLLQENKEAISVTEKKLADKLEAIEREARKANEDRLRTQRVVWPIILIVLILGSLLLGLFFLRKSRTEERVVYTIDVGQKREVPGILKNPDIPALKEFSAQNDGIEKVPFVLTLQDGRCFHCMAKLRDGLDPLVYIENESTPVAWDKRRQSAAKITLSRFS